MGTVRPVWASTLRAWRRPVGSVMASTRAMVGVPGAKTGVARMLAPFRISVMVSDPCLLMRAVAASTRASVTLAPAAAVCTVTRATVVRSWDRTGVDAILSATGLATSRCWVRDAGNGPRVRGSGYGAHATDPPENGIDSGMPYRSTYWESGATGLGDRAGGLSPRRASNGSGSAMRAPAPMPPASISRRLTPGELEGPPAPARYRDRTSVTSFPPSDYFFPSCATGAIVSYLLPISVYFRARFSIVSLYTN